MNCEDIIRVAREVADNDKVDPYINEFLVLTAEELKRFAAVVAAAERDQILEMFNKEGLWDAEGIAATIRGEI